SDLFTSCYRAVLLGAFGVDGPGLRGGLVQGTGDDQRGHGNLWQQEAQIGIAHRGARGAVARRIGLASTVATSSGWACRKATLKKRPSTAHIKPNDFEGRAERGRSVGPTAALGRGASITFVGCGRAARSIRIIAFIRCFWMAK